MPHSKYLMALICALFTLFPRTSSFYGEKLVAFSKGNVLVVGIFNIYKQGNDSQCSEETEPAGMLEFETALYMLKQIRKRLNRISNVHDGTIGYKFYGSCGILQNLVKGVVNIINDEYPIHYFLVLRSMESAEIFTSILSSYKISHIFYGISNFRQITPLLQSTFTTTVLGLSQIMEILIRLTKDWNLDNVQVFYSSEYSSPFFNQLIEQFCSEDLLEMDDTTNLKEENFLQDKSVWNILILITNNVHTMQILENLEEGNHGNFTVITINSDVIHKNMHLHTALDGAVVLMNNVYALPDKYFPNLEKLYNESQIKTFLSTLDEESEKLTSLVDSMLAIEEAYLNLRTVCALQMYACTRNKESLYTALVSATFQGVASKMTFYKNGNIRKDVELVNLIFNGSSLQGQRLGTFSMFKNSFVDMQPYGKGSRAFNFAKLSAAMCNKVCKSNEIKLKTEKKCCWVCQMCKPYEVIVKRGYERCERCPKLFFTNNEQTACIKIQPYYIKSFSHQGILLIVLSFLGITLLLTSLCLIHANRKHPYIKSIYSVPSLTIAVGIMLTFVVPLTFIGYPKVLKCSFYYFFENSQVIFVSVPMLYKLEAMARGFDHRVYRNRSNERPFYFNLFCCIIGLIWVCTLTLNFISLPQKFKEHQPNPFVNYSFIVCEYPNTFFALISYICELFVYISSFYFIYKLRCLPKEFIDAYVFIIGAIISNVNSTFMQIMFKVVKEPMTSFYIACANSYITGFTYLFCLFIFKLCKIYIIDKKKKKKVVIFNMKIEDKTNFSEEGKAVDGAHLKSDSSKLAKTQ